MGCLTLGGHSEGHPHYGGQVIQYLVAKYNSLTHAYNLATWGRTIILAALVTIIEIYLPPLAIGGDTGKEFQDHHKLPIPLYDILELLGWWSVFLALLKTGACHMKTLYRANIR